MTPGLPRRCTAAFPGPAGDGKRLRVYGTTSFLRNQRPFREDWATLFALLEERQIAPVIALAGA